MLRPFYVLRGTELQLLEDVTSQCLQASKPQHHTGLRKKHRGGTKGRVHKKKKSRIRETPNFSTDSESSSAAKELLSLFFF